MIGMSKNLELIKEIKIRQGKISDYQNLAKTHVQSWNEVFHEIIPKNLHYTIEKREKYWKEEVFNNKEDNSVVTVATLIKDNVETIIGFCIFGYNREKEFTDYQHELQTIQILNDYTGLGLGKKLIR
ncbi:hypothetical protein HK099_000955 [Clydaea vesicula]|uniref:N-acetyltransferase domain-containing protein n=1 Tax=Clydaea vesicula TaxID=447962 RepID=A0AAD5TUI7_9FUNG|nr:hypothetical protein HK099_000955 [Clydaea vesicula]